MSSAVNISWGYFMDELLNYMAYGITLWVHSVHLFVDRGVKTRTVTTCPIKLYMYKKHKWMDTLYTRLCIYHNMFFFCFFWNCIMQWKSQKNAAHDTQLKHIVFFWSQYSHCYWSGMRWMNSLLTCVSQSEKCTTVWTEASVQSLKRYKIDNKYCTGTTLPLITTDYLHDVKHFIQKNASFLTSSLHNCCLNAEQFILIDMFILYICIYIYFK